MSVSLLSFANPYSLVWSLQSRKQQYSPRSSPFIVALLRKRCQLVATHPLQQVIHQERRLIQQHRFYRLKKRVQKIDHRKRILLFGVRWKQKSSALSIAYISCRFLSSSLISQSILSRRRFDLNHLTKWPPLTSLKTDYVYFELYTFLTCQYLAEWYLGTSTREFLGTHTRGQSYIPSGA